MGEITGEILDIRSAFGNKIKFTLLQSNAHPSNPNPYFEISMGTVTAAQFGVANFITVNKAKDVVYALKKLKGKKISIKQH